MQLQQVISTYSQRIEAMASVDHPVKELTIRSATQEGDLLVAVRDTGI